MSERAASELQETKRALPESRLADAQKRCTAIEVTRAVMRKPVGELWPGTIFEAGGKAFILVSNRGEKAFGAKIEGGVFDQGASFPHSDPVTVLHDSRAAERDFWERGG